MGNLSSTIIGAAKKYVPVTELIKKTDRFEFIPETNKIVRLKEDEPFKDNFREWKQCKELVTGLSAEYEFLLKKASKESRVIVRKLGKGTEFSVEAKYFGFTVELYVIEDDKGEIRRAEYIAYNKQKNVVFIRDLKKINSISNM